MKDYKNFINEEISSDFSFITEVKDVTIYGLEEYLNKGDDVTIDAYTSIVYWMLQPDMRKNRIKSLDLLVTKVTCDIEWSLFDGENETISVNSNEFKIISDVSFEKDGGVCPGYVEIDYGRKTITVG